jgi:hypothetical protein
MGTLVLKHGYQGLCSLGVPLCWKLGGIRIGTVAYKHAQKPLVDTPYGGEINAWIVILSGTFRGRPLGPRA